MKPTRPNNLRSCDLATAWVRARCCIRFSAACGTSRASPSAPPASEYSTPSCCRCNSGVSVSMASIKSPSTRPANVSPPSPPALAITFLMPPSNGASSSQIPSRCKVCRSEHWRPWRPQHGIPVTQKPVPRGDRGWWVWTCRDTSRFSPTPMTGHCGRPFIEPMSAVPARESWTMLR